MTLAYDVAGDGKPVLLLHSAVGDRRIWEPQWNVLRDNGYRVIRCDLPGFGESPVPARGFHEVTEVLAVLDEVGADPVAVVGSSFGGMIAAMLAAHRPDRVAALLLLAAAPIGRDRSAALTAFGEREDALLAAGDLDAAVALNLDTWLGPDADQRAREWLAPMQRRAFEWQAAIPDGAEDLPLDFRLADITAPTLAVSGAHDLPDFRRFAAEVPDLVPGAAHRELPWAGHLPGVERPDETTRLILDFLAENHWV